MTCYQSDTRRYEQENISLKCTLKIWKRMEKQGKTGIMVFIDLVKAYDRVHRQAVWRRNREKTLPDNYVMIGHNMYEGARTLVKPM